MPFLGNIGPGELIIILVIALVIFGPGKLPEIGQAVGKGIREFRRAASDVTDATRVDTTAPPPAAPPARPPCRRTSPPSSSRAAEHAAGSRGAPARRDHPGRPWSALGLAPPS